MTSAIFQLDAHAGTCVVQALERRVLLNALSGKVFEDRNNNGVNDASPDLGAGGVTVYIDANNNQQLDSGERTATSAGVTSGNWGGYTFADIGTGTFRVRIVTPAGFAQTAPTANGGANVVTISSPTLSAVGINFGIRNLSQFSRIGGRTYGDLNNNGVRDSGDVVLPGVQVYVDLNNNQNFDAAEQTTTSDVGGFWQIDALNPNYTTTYYLRAIAPAGLTQTAPTTNNGAYVVTIDAGNATFPTDVFGFADRTAPGLTDRTIAVATATSPKFVFNENVSYSGTWFLAPSVSAVLGGTVVPFGSVSRSATGNTVTLSFPSLPNEHLPAGLYRATLPAGAVLDSAGNATAGDLTFDFIVVGTGETLTVPPGHATVRAEALAVNPTGKLDLNDADLLIDYATASPRTQVQALINSGRNGGAWTGNGITSTAAKNANPRNRTLGVMESIEFKSIYPGATTFSGEAIDSTAVLMKYTYYGDVDFNGVVDFDDYSRIDAGFNNNRTGWLNGDVDGNGIVDFDDYSLIDQAFNTQGAALRPLVKPPKGRLAR